MIEFSPHSLKQSQAINSRKKITLVGTGIQWGKTRVGAWWMKDLIHENTDKDAAFIITAPTYKILEQSTLPAFLAIMEGCGVHNKTKASFECVNGSIVYMRTCKDPDSIVGITNVKGIWGDEAGKYPLYFWENIMGRAAFKSAPIMLTTSPYTLNWIYKDLIKPFRAGKRDDLNLIQARSDENPYFPKTTYQQARSTMDPRRFNMMFGGEWGRMEGLVYDCFDEDTNVVDPSPLPPGTQYYAGIDWGYNPDPFALVVKAITPDGYHYQVSEYCRTGHTIPDIVRICKAAKATWDIKLFYCGFDEPGSIEELNRNGVPAMKADNDLSRGIGLLYELIKTQKFKIWRDTSPHTLDELETYHYPEPKDLGPDDHAKLNKPVGQSDHCLDALRYVTISTYRSGLKLTPKHPDSRNIHETQYARIKRLQSAKKHYEV